MFKGICTEWDDGTVEELCKMKCKELGRKQPSYVYKCVITEIFRKTEETCMDYVQVSQAYRFNKFLFFKVYYRLVRLAMCFLVT